MDQERWQKIEDLYHSARDIPSEERAAYLYAVCAGDAELREEVASLLAEAEHQDNFLSEPTLTLGLSLLHNEQSSVLRSGRLSRYGINKLLGRGGMGEVYLAEDSQLERPVALKLLPPYLSGQDLSVRRFEREARASSGISHPNVAHIYEIGEAEGYHYIAMEYVEGESLRALLGRESLRLGEAVEVALQVANALAAAHAAGVIHRDIKPENILIRRDGLVKVVDFGLAKLATPRRSAGGDSHETYRGSPAGRMIHTQSGMLMGTVNYMSPEQARGQEVDERTDIWSWGVMFYEMLAGDLPFTGETSSDVIAEILKSEPLHLQPGLPGTITQILKKSLSKDKDSRYASALELSAEVRGLLRQLAETDLLQLGLPLGVSVPLPNDLEQNAPLAPSASPQKLVPESDGINNIARGSVTLPTRAAQTVTTPLPPSKSLRVLPEYLGRPMARAALLVGLSGLVIALVTVIYANRGWLSESHGSVSAPPRITYLTKDGRIMDAAISSDARHLAYVPIDSGRQSLWVRNLESGEERQLLPPALAWCWGMRFTPDGRSLLYIINQPNDSAGVLYRMPADGGPPDRVAVNVSAPPAISPDGSQVSFVRTYPVQHRDVLIIANADGTSEREVASRQYPDRFSLSSASWSPDGKLIAVGGGRNNDTESAVLGIPVNGDTPVELTPWRWAAVGGIAWESDGSALTLSARPLGAKVLQLWRLSYPGGELRRLTEDENSYEEVTQAQSGKVLATTHTYEVSDIWVIPQSDGPRRLTTQSHEGADGLAVIPSGRIVYTVGEYEQSRLWSMNLEGGDRKLLIENNGFLPSASRDGRFIAYVSTERGVYHIWLMDTEGRHNRQLTDSQGEFSPSITADGKWVVYASLIKDRSSLWRISTAGGPPIQLTSDFAARRPVVSPDGTKIACAYRQSESEEWRIAILPFDGGEPLHKFALPFPRNQMIRWAPDGKALIYLDKRDGVHNLWRYPLDGSAPEQITRFTEDLILHYDYLNTGGTFVISRGGRRRDIALVKGSE